MDEPENIAGVLLASILGVYRMMRMAFATLPTPILLPKEAGASTDLAATMVAAKRAWLTLDELPLGVDTILAARGAIASWLTTVEMFAAYDEEPEPWHGGAVLGAAFSVANNVSELAAALRPRE